MRQPFPSRAASALFYVGAAMVATGFIVIFLGPPQLGRLIGVVGLVAAFGAAWLNRRRNPPGARPNSSN